MIFHTNMLRSQNPTLYTPSSGRLAQLVEQLTLNQRVVGSNPSASTIFSITYE